MRDKGNEQELQKGLEKLKTAYGLSISRQEDSLALSLQLLQALLQTAEENKRLKQAYDSRYHLIAALMNEVLFEFHLRKRIMSDSIDWNRYANADAFLKGSVARGIIHPDDVAAFLHFFSGEEEMQVVHEVIIRLRPHPQEDYVWTNIKGIILPGIDGFPEKIIGVRTPIDTVKKEMELLRSQAQKDELTSLYNKATTRKISESLLKKEQKVACIIFDIDDFKLVNDRFGHVFGDIVLSHTAKEIKKLFNQEEVIGRIGGDEFFAAFPYQTEEEVKQRCCLLIQTFQSLSFQNSTLKITGTAGIALYPKHATTYIDLLKKGDIALYKAKQAGKNQFCFYE